MTQNTPAEVFKGGWRELQNAKFTDNQIVLPTSSSLSFTMKPDGTEIYVIDILDVRTFSLAIPYDLNSLDITPIRSFTITDNLTPIGITFQKGEFAGSRMFVGGDTGTVMLSYTLPVPFDTDSIITSPVSLSLSAITGVLRNSTFSRDGDFIFIATSSPNLVFSYPLPTPWDITSNVSDTSFDPGLGTLFGIAVKPEGDKMCIIDITANDVIEFDMSTPNDISTLVANGNVLDFGTANFRDLEFRSNGIEVFFIQPIGDFIKFHMNVDWNISTASYFSNELTGVVDYQGISWKSDGTKFFAINSGGGDRIDSYDVPEIWNQTNAVLTGNFSLAGIATAPRGLWVSSDGLTCMVLDNNNDSIVQLNMSTSWDIGAMSDPGIAFDLNAGAGLTNPTGVAFSKDLLTMYVTDSNNDGVTQFSLSSPLDITSAVDTGNFLLLPDDAVDVFLRPDDSLLYVGLRFDDRIQMYSLPADGNVSNAVFIEEFLVDFLEDNLQGFFIRQNDGKKLWIVGNQSAVISSLDMSLEFNNTIISDFGEELITQVGETIVYA